jgi:hypothetical protein
MQTNNAAAKTAANGVGKWLGAQVTWNRPATAQDIGQSFSQALPDAPASMRACDQVPMVLTERRRMALLDDRRVAVVPSTIPKNNTEV